MNSLDDTTHPPILPDPTTEQAKGTAAPGTLADNQNLGDHAWPSSPQQPTIPTENHS